VRVYCFEVLFIRNLCNDSIISLSASEAAGVRVPLTNSGEFNITYALFSSNKYLSIHCALAEN
jgi:hypothetical protein